MNIVMLGATGAVGSNVLAALAADPRAARITVLARRPLAGPVPAKAVQHIVDVLDPKSWRGLLPGHDAAVCTLGVGQPSKVSRAEYLKVDRDTVIAFASACGKAGVRHFELLGSVAADTHSKSFYLKSKGELRDAIAAMDFARFSCFQPSMLLTKENRYGFGQAVTLAIWPLLAPLLVGGLKKYRGIAVEHLGTAMARNLFTTGQGTEILHWPDFARLARRAS